MTTSAYLCAHLPLSLHFGWITAAAVVSLNSLAALTLQPAAQLATAFVSVTASAATGVAVAFASGDPLYALTLAWALNAVAADGGRRAKETMGELPLQALTLTARAGAYLLLAAAAGQALRGGIGC
eukprot:scaffold125195_cov44-Prasinocladus_malaysianus.AAC.2